MEEQIYPNVSTGFTDSNAYLRELTLKSMLVLAPKLSQRTLNQSLLKFLAKLQVGALAPVLQLQCSLKVDIALTVASLITQLSFCKLLEQCSPAVAACIWKLLLNSAI